MRRRWVLAFLAVGTVIGYSSGFSHLHRWRAHRDAWFEGRCDAMRRADAPPGAPAAPAPVAP